MALTIPNIESSPTFDGQSVPDATDFAALQGTDDGNGVISGCQVSAQSSPNMTVQVAAGSVLINGQVVAVSAVSSLTIGAASTYDRKDIVTVNSSGTVSVTAGTPCTTAGWTRSTNALPPVKAAIPSNSVLLGEVYVASTTTSVASGNIVDKTALTVAGNVLSGSLSSDVSLAQNTLTTVLTTGTLGVGTWLVTFACPVLIGAANESVDFEIVVGTATATITGTASTTVGYTTAIGGGAVLEASLDVVAVVTSAGTLVVKAEMAGASTASTVKHTSYTQGFANAAGYAAVRIA